MAIEGLVQDVRAGFRTIWKAPGFALVVILTLALGIGANTAVFSVIYAVLLRPPAYPNGERIVELLEAAAGQKLPVSWINFQHWRNENHTFADMAGFETADVTLSGRGEAVLTHAGVVSASFFKLTGWRPATGRLLTEADDRPGAMPVAIVSGEFWRSSLGNDPHVAGTALNLDGRAYQVIGVLPPGLRFFTRPVDIYVAAGPRYAKTVDRAEHGGMEVLGLLKPGIKLRAAQAELDGIMHRLSMAEPGPEAEHRSSVTWFGESGTDEIRPTLLVLMGAVGLVLMLACANVASLLLVRSTTRVRELAIRAAIGAGKGRIVRQLFTENLVVIALGGGAGLLLAGACLRLLITGGPRDIPRLWEAGLNVPVLLFSAMVTVLTGLLAGIAPALHAGKVDLTLALKEGSAASGGGRKGHSLRGGLVVSEIAVTLVLAFGCGLLLRSLIMAQTAYPGFDAGRVLALELQLPPARYQGDDAARRFYTRLIEELRNKAGVEAVGAVNCPPSAACARGWYSIADMPAPAKADVPLTFLSSVEPGYFRVLKMRLLAGRGFTQADRAGEPRVAVVNEKLARHWWPDAPQLAVGHPLKLGGPYLDGATYDIVGVVASVPQAGLDTEPSAEVHVAFAQNPSPAMVVMLRTASDPARLIPLVRRELASIDRNVAVQSLRPFEQWMGATLERRRFSTLLLGIFAALAVTLSAVGIYGILNYWVGVRQKEIAIRLALGAQRSEIMQWTGWHALRPIALGIALGVLGCWGVSRWLTSLVFGVSAQDPATLLAAGLAVIAVAALAASVPTWRASRVDVIRKLRDG